MSKGSKKEVIARFSSFGQKFEIVVDSEKVERLKGGENIPIADVVVGDFVFSDIAKAEKVPDETLEKIFGTTDFDSIAKRIIDDGEIQLTVEQRREMLDRKKDWLVNYISRHAVDPRTGRPHPPARIGLAMDEARVRVDPFQKAENQVNDVLKAIRPLIPLSIESKIIAFKIPVNYAGTLRASIARKAKILKDEWLGSYWMCEVEVPAGMADELFADVNSVTHGDNESRVLEKKL